MIQRGIPCMLIRGGTSKGAYFLARDLPADVAARDRVLLAIMGSPDKRQIDGLGGAHPLTSKTAIVAPSTEPGCDIDFLFAQIGIEQPKVDTTPNCGNILAGIGPFALARGLVKANDPRTIVRVRTLNTGTIADLELQIEKGQAKAEGTARIDGVPGTSAPIAISFLDTEGSVCGALLPTGRVVDVIDGIPCTLIDNGMPVIVLRASDVDRTGYESVEALNKDNVLKARLERIRLAAGLLMNLGDVTDKVVPKIALVAPPSAGGALSTRSFIPHECHAAIGVFAAVSVATAAALLGSPAASVAVMPQARERIVSVEHPTGEFSVSLTVGGTEQAPRVEKAGLVRTARILMDGTAYIPGGIDAGFSEEVH
ncbi:4-oxalomesaconate tautomerase [Rhizobiales bacterium TNE-4]|nr:4-oxalomesaconate tautomerase [Rhizobiales bacterium TNE-4]MBV1826994.1 4-oxalomesaconate tautomerase [Rhizobiales bacterium TNE-4]